MNGSILNSLDIIKVNPEDFITYDTCLFLQHLAHHEIFTCLPRLEESEKQTRNNIKKETIFKKDKLKDFYEYLKKKYINFMQLAYVNDDLLHEFYTYQFEHDFEKDNYISDFNYSTFFYQFHSESLIDFSEEEFKKSIDWKFKEFNKYECLKLEHLIDDSILETPWANIKIDAIFANKKTNEREALVNLIKYDPDFSSDSIILDFFLLYSDIEKDLFSILFHKKQINHLIVYFSEKKYWSTFKHKEMEYENNEKYNHDINQIIKIIFNKLKNLHHIYSLILVSEKFEIILNEENSENLAKLINYEQGLGILVLENIVIHNFFKNYFVKNCYGSIHLKYLNILGTIIFNTTDSPDINEFKSKYNDSSKVYYIKFDSSHIFDNIKKCITNE